MMTADERHFASGALSASVAGGIGRLFIDNGPRKNALTAAMWDDLPVSIAWLTQEAGARVILLGGAGGRDFSAGADISEFERVRADAASAKRYEASNAAAFAAVREAPVPVIAVIRGVCFGGGLGLAAAADLRLGDDTAIACVPAARLGLAYPAEAVADLIDALGLDLATRALFTGARYDWAELTAAGFFAEYVPAADLDRRAEALAGEIAANAPLSLAAAKLAIRAARKRDPDLLAAAGAAGAATFESADYREGRAAFAEKRRPVFRGR